MPCAIAVSWRRRVALLKSKDVYAYIKKYMYMITTDVAACNSNNFLWLIAAIRQLLEIKDMDVELICIV